MKDIVREYQEQFRHHRLQLRRYTALLLALAMVTTLFVNWQLHSDGIAKTAEYLCGKEEHEHTAECYPQVLVCGYEEGEPEDWTVSQPDSDATIDESFGVDADDEYGIADFSAEPEYIFVPHEHTADCYQEVTTEVPVLTCFEEEHEHTDDCFDPEDGSLICDKFEHTHDDSCYTIEYETEEELTCGLEEGELVEELNPDYNPVAMFEAPVAAKPVVVEPVAEGPVHHHTDACYAPDYTAEPICGMEEHHHDVNCLSDPLDSVEDESDWLAQTDTTLTGVWTDDLLSVAKSQLDYEQSEKNFRLDTDDGETLRYYTRYGQWYGSPYGPWDVTFLSYCLNYAGIPESAIPQASGAQTLHSQLRGTEYMGDFAGDLPIDAVMPGDIVFYTTSTKVVVAVEDSQPAVSDDSPDADIALLSMDAAASEPQTEETTVTDTTVGIVSDVDYDAGTLTVISGNVDGKVAEVTLNASQVTSLVSVATAQALNEDGAAEQPDNTGMDGSSYVTSTDIQIKKGIDYVSSDTFNLTETAHGKIQFSKIPLDDILSSDRRVYYDLPAEFIPLVNLNGKLVDTDTGKESGTYSFVQNTDGSYRLVLTYNEEYLREHAGQDATVDSTVQFDFNWNEEHIKKDGQNTIDFGKKNFTITIRDDTPDTPTQSQFNLNKSASSLSYDGKDAYITYTVKLTVNSEAKAPLVLEDVLANPSNALFQYDGDPTISGGDSTPSITWEKGAADASRTFTIGKDGEMIEPGEYEITYKVKCENFGKTSVDGYVKNSVSIKDHEDVTPKETWTSVKTSLISKSGSVSDNSAIKWTVNINNGDVLQYLDNETFTDTIPDGLTLDQSTLTIKRTDADGNEVTVVKKGQLVSDAKESLTIENGKITCKLADGFYSYKITYTTTVDNADDLPLNGTTFTNTGKVDGGSGSASSSSDKTVKPERLSKKAVGTPAIDPETNKAVLSWESVINVNGSLNGYHYYDYSGKISLPSNGDPSDYNNYKSYKAQTILLNSIVVLDADGNDITETLKNADAIKEYSSCTEVDDSGVNCGLFEIDFGSLDINGPVKISYDTEVDMSRLYANKDFSIENNCYITDSTGKQSEIEKASQTISTKDTTERYLKKSVSDNVKLKVGQKLTWTVSLNESGKMPNFVGDSITITDTLPYGMLLDESSIQIDFNHLNDHGVPPIKGENYFIQLGETDEGRLTITVILKKKAYFDSNNNKVQSRIFLTYDTMLDPDKIDELFSPDGTLSEAAAVATFKNDATLDYGGNHESTSAETTVKLKILGKEGSYNDVTGTLSYTVKVNPTGADLSGGKDGISADTLTLYDKLDPGSLYKRISLDSISVFSARLENGDLVEDSFLYDLMLEDTDCSDNKAKNLTVGSYGVNVNNSEDDKDHFIKVWTKIANRTPLILVFNYSVDTEDLVAGNYDDLSNQVKINGQWSYEEKSTSADHSSSGTSNRNLTNDRLSIVKYSGGLSNTVSGAKFKVEYYDGSSWQLFYDAGKSEFVTGSNGQCYVNGLQRGVVYRILETEAPPEYIQPAPDAYHYFYIQTSNGTALPSIPEVDPVQIDVRKPNDASVYQTFIYYCNNTRNPDYVHPGSLKVTKQWLDSAGNEITDKSTLSVLKPVHVKLVQHSKNVTVTIKGSQNTSRAITLPVGAGLSFKHNWNEQYQRSDNGTVIASGDTYTFPNIQSDITITVTTGWVQADQIPDDNIQIDPSTATGQTIDTVIDPTAELSYDNGWTYTWNELPTSTDGSIWYTLEEVSTTDDYETSYKVGSAEASATCPTITLTPAGGVSAQVINKSTQSDSYELPSTGGAGTTPYTAVGGAIALAALVCGVCQKRRRERRAHN